MPTSPSPLLRNRSPPSPPPRADRAPFEARLDQLGEGAGAVADVVLILGSHFAERHRVSIRHEYGVVAEAALAARRPRQRPMALAAKRRALAPMLIWRPGERQHRDEMGLPGLVAQFAMHPLHCDAEILGLPGPARRIDAGRAAERRHHQAGIVG